MPFPRIRESRRRGAVTAEFAFVAPTLLLITMGVTEASRLFEVQTQLSTAAREGARIAAMSRDGILSAGDQTNEKIVDDVKNFLSASGLPKDQITVTITDNDNPSTEFDLDNTANDLKLFRLKVSIPISAVTSSTLAGASSAELSTTLVFRNAQASITQ